MLLEGVRGHHACYPRGRLGGNSTVIWFIFVPKIFQVNPSNRNNVYRGPSVPKKWAVIERCPYYRGQQCVCNISTVPHSITDRIYLVMNVITTVDPWAE